MIVFDFWVQYKVEKVMVIDNENIAIDFAIGVHHENMPILF